MGIWGVMAVGRFARVVVALALGVTCACETPVRKARKLGEEGAEVAASIQRDLHSRRAVRHWLLPRGTDRRPGLRESPLPYRALHYTQSLPEAGVPAGPTEGARMAAAQGIRRNPRNRRTTHTSRTGIEIHSPLLQQVSKGVRIISQEIVLPFYV